MYNSSININDEAAQGFEEKLKLCGKLVINNIETMDQIDGKKICDLNGSDVEDYRNLLIDYNKKIVLINMNELTGDIAYYRKMMRNAHLLGVENIGISTYGLDYSYGCTEVLADICKTSKAYGIGVLFENSCKSVYSTEKEFNGLYNNIKNEYTGLIFNPLEYARNKAHPFFHIFYNSSLKNHIRFLRINDGLFHDGSARLPGEGNAEIKELASIMLARSFRGYFSFFPYWENMNLEDYKNVITSFKKILKEI